MSEAELISMWYGRNLSGTSPSLSDGKEIPKGNGKTRPLGYSYHHGQADTAMCSAGDGADL